MNAPKAKTVEELLEQIRQAASGGDYIFRGESKKHPKVTSTLYRVYQDKIEAEHFNIEEVEKEIVSEVRKHTDEKDDNAILEQLQHYRGKTNQIDFSTDYLVALFFACDGNYKADGRLILLNKKGVKTHKPTNPKNRVIAQKSIFIRSPKGFVELDDEVPVPSALKEEVLEYLNKYHNINTATIYNDIHGYIAQTEIHESAYTYFYFGLTHQNKGEFLQAIEEYTKAIELNPNLVEAYTNRGNSYRIIREHDLAIVDHNKAIEINPNDAGAYNNRGAAYSSKGENDIAIADYNKAIELNPNLAEAYSNRGNAYRDKGEHDFALTDHNKAIEINSDDAKAYNNRGGTYGMKGDNDLAITDYNKAIELDPNFAAAYFNRGVAYSNKRDYDSAIDDFNKASELNPNDAEAYNNRCKTYNNRGIVYEQKGDNDLAITDYNKAIELCPNSTEAYNNRGGVYGKKGDHDLAINDFNKAIELNPNYAEAYINRSTTKVAMQDYKGAKEDYEIALPLAEKRGRKDLVDLIQKEIAKLPPNSNK